MLEKRGYRTRLKQISVIYCLPINMDIGDDFATFQHVIEVLTRPPEKSPIWYYIDICHPCEAPTFKYETFVSKCNTSLALHFVSNSSILDSTLCDVYMSMYTIICLCIHLLNMNFGDMTDVFYCTNHSKIAIKKFRLHLVIVIIVKQKDARNPFRTINLMFYLSKPVLIVQSFGNSARSSAVTLYVGTLCWLSKLLGTVVALIGSHYFLLHWL